MALNFINNLSQQSYTELGLQLLTSLYIKPKVAIKKKGLRMPQDIGLVGFNNEPVVSLVSPSISSVEQPSFELGKVAAKLFIETMHHNEDLSSVDQILKPKLFIRESSQKSFLKNGRIK